jgi:DNA (cytosine-5)-methyltransferase 1
MVFHEVCADLENIGYEVQAFIIPASGINAPHQRERLWIVAHTNGNECNKRGQSINGREINKLKNGNKIWHKSTPDGKQRDVADTESQRAWEQSSEDRGWEDGRFNDISEDGDATDTDSIGLEGQRRPIGELERQIRFSSTSSRNIWNTAWDNFPTQSPVCGGDDGISHRLDNITFSKWRNESIKGYGNAVVPQVVYRIFKTIEYIQNLKP